MKKEFIRFSKAGVRSATALEVIVRVSQIVSITQASELERLQNKSAKTVIKLINGDSIISSDEIARFATKIDV